MYNWFCIVYYTTQAPLSPAILSGISANFHLENKKEKTHTLLTEICFM